MKTIKKLVAIIIALVAVQNIYAQRIGNLEGINYQAVAVDDEGKEIVGMDINGKPLYSKEIGVKFSILKGNDGPVQYQETHTVLTDKYGLFSLTIGLGTQTGEGAYTKLLDMPWIDADQWLKVEIAIKNDGSYKLVSLQKFQTVPYSFYTDDIADNAITTEKILDSTILNQDLSTGSVDSRTILNETILAEDIATGAVTTDEILNETILAEDIATGAVTTDEILNGTILNEDIANGTIDLTTKVTGILPVQNGGTGLDASGVLDGQVLIGNDANNNFDLATLTAGAGIAINNTPGGIEIVSTVVGIGTAQTPNVISPSPITQGNAWISAPQNMGAGTCPMGSFVLVSLPVNLQGLTLTGYTNATDQVTLVLNNASGATVDLPNGITPRILCIP
ncbi:MAG: hypothetical protein ACLGGV_08945 [Bacteroidia bacterium]